MRDLRELDRHRLTKLEVQLYGVPGDSGNGVFGIHVDGKLLHVVASNGGGWDHVSVSRPSRDPSWREMAAIKRLFFRDDECVVEYHPPKADYVNMHEHCLHLWRPNDGTEIPRPPKIMVGW